MAENPGPSDAAGKRPRITPTIDLTATEVARDLGTPESSAAAFGGESAAEFGSGQERSGAAAAEMNPDLPPDTMQASSAAGDWRSRCRFRPGRTWIAARLAARHRGGRSRRISAPVCWAASW